jgi:hypothetical protein
MASEASWRWPALRCSRSRCSSATCSCALSAGRCVNCLTARGVSRRRH